MREAILRLTDEQLEGIGLGGVVATAREAGLRELTELVCHGPGGVIMFRVDEPVDEEAFDGFEAVEWWERLLSTDEGTTYLCRIRA
ncbi:MAG: hypothetical protein R3324_13655, partial [Halobacteriales archaeon]|nr:hypothetical protein [Halobacteriales archaeon]